MSEKTKVLLIGIRKEHWTSLQALFKDTHEIDAIHDKLRHDKPINNIHKYDKIIVLIRFTRHTCETHYSKHKGYTRVSGGMSSVRRILETGESFSYNCNRG